MRDIKENKIAIGVIFLLSFLVYGNTLNHEFVLDDKIVITENSFTKKGIDGIGDQFSNDSMTGFFGKSKSLVQGGRYRPLSMASHAIEWEFAEDEPFLYHFNNVLLYALGGVLLYLVLLKLFPSTSSIWYLSFAFLVALLFQLNPLHTEVVANIKSRDEILSVVLALGAMLAAINYLKSDQRIRLGLVAFLFLLGLLSKEGVIVLLGIFPLMLWASPNRYKLSSILWTSGAMLGGTLIYLFIRLQVIGGAQIETADELMNNPFLHANFEQRWSTIAYVLFEYIRLLVWPHPLTHDYYPNQIELTSWGDPIALLGILLHLSLVALFVYGIKKRSIPGLAAGIYLGGIVLYANIVFQIGTFMNERFLYIPVLGFAILTVWLINKYVSSKGLRTLLFAALILGYSAKTIARNMAWESDETLSLTDIEVSSNSAKAHLAAGIALLNRGEKQRIDAKKRKDLNTGIKHLKRSLEIYPNYSPPILLLGNAYTNLGQYELAIQYYETCLKSNTQVEYALKNLEIVGDVSTVDQNYATAEKALLIHLKYREKASVYEAAGELYGKYLGQMDKAIDFLEKAFKLDANNPDIIQKLGVAYALSGRNGEAVGLFEKGVQLSPENANMWLNLGFAYHGEGRLEDSERSLSKAYELDPKLAPAQ